MGKKCEKCLKKYDDTWGVCLFCGSELKEQEKCEEVCEVEGTTLEKEEEKEETFNVLFFV